MSLGLKLRLHSTQIWTKVWIWKKCPLEAACGNLWIFLRDYILLILMNTNKEWLTLCCLVRGNTDIFFLLKGKLETSFVSLLIYCKLVYLPPVLRSSRVGKSQGQKTGCFWAPIGKTDLRNKYRETFSQDLWTFVTVSVIIGFSPPLPDFPLLSLFLTFSKKIVCNRGAGECRHCPLKFVSLSFLSLSLPVKDIFCLFLSSVFLSDTSLLFFSWSLARWN